MKINVSFSGGASSGYMVYLLKNHPKFKDNEYRFVFANTGQEHEKTLDFVNNCDKYFNLNLVWIEAKVRHSERKGATFSITNYKEAARKGEPFEEVVKKYGLPNIIYKLCNREMKTNPMEFYRKSIGWNQYPTALGIRHDEQNRIKGHFYPLNELKKDKQDVVTFWEDMPFKLEIAPHQGNCTWCIEKSVKKLATVYSENPEFFNFPRKLEKLYGRVAREDDKPDRRLFRGNLTVKDIEKLSKNISPLLFDEDDSGGCGESCEAQ